MTRSIDSPFMRFIRREAENTILSSFFMFAFNDKSVSGSSKIYLTGFDGSTVWLIACPTSVRHVTYYPVHPWLRSGFSSIQHPIEEQRQDVPVNPVSNFFCCFPAAGSCFRFTP